MTRSGWLYDLIRNAMLNAVTVMETVYMVPEGSVAILSSRTSDTRLPINACAHTTIEGVTTMTFFAPIPPSSLSRGPLVPNIIV